MELTENSSLCGNEAVDVPHVDQLQVPLVVLYVISRIKFGSKQ